MSRRSKATEFIPSSLLRPQENERMEDLLGRRCTSLATAVVQLYMALPHSPAAWSLQHTGVVCFVRDNHRRSYYFRLFDMKVGKQVWEQELYNQLVYYCARPFFHSFAANDCQVGLNFVSEQEAESFHDTVEEKINQRSNRLEKHRPSSTPSRDRGALPPLPPLHTPNGSPAMAIKDIQNPDIQAFRYRSTPTAATVGGGKDKDKKDKKSKKKGSKLSKLDIGAPSGFMHVSHVGMDPNNLDPALKMLLSRAGISESQLTDTETQRLISDVIEQSGGMEAVKKAMNTQDVAPPPPVGRQGRLPPLPGSSPSQAPAPSPSRGRSGPLPPTPGAPQQGPSSRGPTPPLARGTLPPLPSGARSGPLPPPPSASRPPPPSSASRPPPPSASHYPPPTPSASFPPPPPSASHYPPPPPSASFPPPPPSASHYPPPPSASHYPPPPPSASFPPPPPSASFPPPPPSASHYPPPPPSASVPPPPPPSRQHSMAAPPPPQAAPSFSRGPPPSPAPPAASPSGGGGGGRGDLLDQIRSGRKLKMVTSSPDLAPPPSVESEEGIVGALMMAMQKRSKAIQCSDEGEEFGGDDEEDDEWD